MPIIASCPDCEAKLKFPDSASGKKVRCPKCSGIIPLPGEPSGVKSPPAPAGLKTAEAQKPIPLAPQTETSANDFDLGFADSPSASGSRKRKASSARDYDDYDDDDYDRENRRSRRKDYDDDDYDDYADKKGMGKGAIIGIICGVVAMLAGIAVVVIILLNKDDGDPNGLANAKDFDQIKDINKVKDLNQIKDLNKIKDFPGARDGVIRPPQFVKSFNNLDEALTAANDASSSKRNAAASFIDRAPVDAGKQKQVAAVLNKLLNDPDNGVKSIAAHAAMNWATTDNVPALIALLDPKASGLVSGTEKNAIQALGRLKDPRGGKAIVPYLGNFFVYRDAQAALEEMGAQAEPGLLEALNHPNRDCRNRSRTLLEKLNVAEEKMLTQSLVDVVSKEKERKRSAIEWLSKATVNNDKRKEVARVLDANMMDERGKPDPNAIKALANWGDKDHAATFAAYLDEGRVGSFLNEHQKIAMKFLGDNPTETGATSVARWLTTTFAPNEALDALKKMPADIVGKALVKIMHHPDRRVQQRVATLIKDTGVKPEQLINQIAADLQSTERGTRIAAAESAEKTALVAAEQTTISRSLGNMLTSGNRDEEIAAMKALVIWGTKTNIPQIVPWVADLKKSFGHDGEMKKKGIEILSNLQDESGITPVAMNLGQPFGISKVASDSLKKFGPKAEKVVITFLGNRDPGLRIEACQILQVIGGEDSMKALKSVSRREKDRRVQAVVIQTAQIINARLKAAAPPKPKP